jgi:hypothetical protein
MSIDGPVVVRTPWFSTAGVVAFLLVVEAVFICWPHTHDLGESRYRFKGAVSAEGRVAATFAIHRDGLRAVRFLPGPGHAAASGQFQLALDDVTRQPAVHIDVRQVPVRQFLARESFLYAFTPIQDSATRTYRVTVSLVGSSRADGALAGLAFEPELTSWSYAQGFVNHWRRGMFGAVTPWLVAAAWVLAHCLAVFAITRLVLDPSEQGTVEPTI